MDAGLWQECKGRHDEKLLDKAPVTDFHSEGAGKAGAEGRTEALCNFKLDQESHGLEGGLTFEDFHDQG
jgi:hypothetical protein